MDRSEKLIASSNSANCVENNATTDDNNIKLPESVCKHLEKLVNELNVVHKTKKLNLIYDGMLTRVVRVNYYNTPLDVNSNLDASGGGVKVNTGAENNNSSSSDGDKETVDDTPPVHSFIIKLIKNSNTLEDDYDVVPAFLREFIFYQKVYPNFIQFQRQSKQLNLFDPSNTKGTGFIVPKYYKVVKEGDTTPQYSLIFEDMTRNGYHPTEKNKPLGLAHCKLVMEALGRLHGVSFAFKDQDPKQFSKFEKLVDPLFERIAGLEHTIQDFVITCIDEAIEALETHEVFRKEKLIELKESVFHTILSYVSLDFADPYCVIGHGDCWAPNLLFKNDPTDTMKPTSVCFLDFQLCRYASPVLDLSYFLFTSTNAALRNEHLPNLYRVYYESLAATIKTLGSDPETLFSWTTFQQHLKRFGGYGFIMTMLQMDDIVPEDEPDDTRPPYQRQASPEYTSRRRGSITPIAPLHSIPLAELAKKTDRQKHLAGVVRDVIRLGYI